MADRRVDTIPASLLSVDLGHETITDAATWQVTRSLSGGGLPGQARAVSGSSVGSGSVTLPDRTGASPWSATPPMPGGSAVIQAMHDAAVPMSGGPLGWRPVASMRVRSIGAGSLLSGARDVEIEDDVPRGSVTLPAMLVSDGWETALTSMDASGVIDMIARAGGYVSTRPPVAGTVFSLPMVGSTWIERSSAPTGVGWGDVTYTSVGGEGMAHGEWNNGFLDDGIVLSGFTRISVRMAAQSGTPSGSTYLRIWAAPGVYFSIDGGPGSVSLGSYGGSTQSAAADLTGDPVQVDVMLGGGMAYLYVGGVYTGKSVATAVGVVKEFTVRAQNEAAIGALYIDTGLPSPVPSHPDLDVFVPSALISPAGSPLSAVMSSQGDSWSMIQQAAAATLGAAWIDESGRLVYRGRDAMRGGEPVATVDVLDDAEDLPWSLSGDEASDRVAVTYQAPVVRSDTYVSRFTAWESTDVTMVRAGQSVTIVQDLDVVAYGVGQWLPVWSTVNPAGVASRWNAFPNADGTGAQPADDALAITATMIGGRRVSITIRNRAAATLYVTQLTLRVRHMATPGEPRTLSAGATEEVARTPLSVDLGAWVQDDDVAQEILSWLVGTTSAPLPIIGPVRVAADSERRLGDAVLVRLRSGVLGPDGEPVASWTVKALVSGISQSAAPGEYQQTYTLAALNATAADLARYLTARSITTAGDLAAHWTALLGPSATAGDIAAWITPGGLYS